ncbi:MAG TPA: ATP-binding protein [Patescibacteria group bacterium]|nr:ATP-binding protein [Patescibacteria group bacterium]
MPKKKAARTRVASNSPDDLASRVVLQSTALAAAGNGIVITDRAGAVLWVNPAFTSLTGYSPQEILGANLRILKSGHQPPSFYNQFWQTILEGRVWRGEFVNRRKDGSIYINEETITPVRLNGTEITHFVGVMQDVTERREAEAHIRALNDELEHRVKIRTAELESANQELEAFAYSVSHDLRAPLRHINGFLDLLIKSALPALSDEEKYYLTLVANSARQMDRLIDDLLLFSRMAQATMHPAKVDFNQLLQEILTQLAPETKGRSIVWKKGDLPTVHGDQAMLRQALLNLLSNSVKYTASRNPAVIEISSTEQDSEIVVTIHDNGVGFDMRFADKLFGVFQRLHPKDQFEGTGIGLANVRRIIQRHGGRTWAEGKPDLGATFYFSLPKGDAHPSGTAPP